MLEPRNAGPFNDKGISLAELGRDIDAVTSFEKAIELDPLDTRPWIGKASAEDRLGR